MPTVNEYACMADQVYKPNGGVPPSGWVLMDYAAPPNRWGFRVAAYRNPVAREIVISFMGTHEPIQHLGNAGLAVGNVPPQQGDAEEKVRQVLRASAALRLTEAAQQVLPHLGNLSLATRHAPLPEEKVKQMLRDSAALKLTEATQQVLRHVRNPDLAAGHALPQQGDAEEKVRQALRDSAALKLAETAQQVLRDSTALGLVETTQQVLPPLENLGLAAGNLPSPQRDVRQALRDSAVLKLTEAAQKVLLESTALRLAEAAQQVLPPTFLERFFTFIGEAVAAVLRGNSISKALSEFLRTEAKNIIRGFEMAAPAIQDVIAKIQETAPEYHVSITGHSLGGCIAELCAARFCLNATTFDSPGSMELIVADPRYNKPDYSNITSYLSAPNIVNTLYGHAGTCYRVFIPFIPEGWTWSHAGRSIFASASRISAYGITFFSGGAATPLTTAGFAGIVSFIMGGTSAASIFGVIPTSNDFKRQHSIVNIVEALNAKRNLYRQPIPMISWPRLSEIQWTTFFTGLRALAPIPKNSPGIRVMFDQNAMIEAQIASLDGYKEGQYPAIYSRQTIVAKL